MSETDVPEFLLPKGRTIAIHGDTVRTLRIQNRLSVIQLAAEADLSEDRIMEIEKGGQKVYPDSFLRIAEALGLGKDWRPLLDGVARSGAAATPTGKRVLKAIVIDEDYAQFIEKNRQDEVIQKLSRLIDAVNEIIVHVVRKGSVVIEVEMSEGDWQKLEAAFVDGKLDDLGILNIGDVEGARSTLDGPPPRPIRDAFAPFHLKIRPFARVAALLCAMIFTIALMISINDLTGIDAKNHWLEVMQAAMPGLPPPLSPEAVARRKLIDTAISIGSIFMISSCLAYLWIIRKK